jgi:hypothetical protein
MANRIMPGYKLDVSEKIEIVVDHDGPASYVNTGTFATSGETINAADFGLGGFELVQIDALSSDGLNIAYAVLTNQSNSNTPQGTGANAVPNMVIHWFVFATNTEVANGVNLSGKSIRLQIRGV